MTYIFVSVDNADSRGPHESVGMAKRFLQLEGRQKGSLGVHFVERIKNYNFSYSKIIIA